MNSKVGECLVGYAIRDEGHWLKNLLGRYARWKGSPGTLKSWLTQTAGWCWKDTLGRKKTFKTHRPPYPTRRGLVTAWQETKKLLHGNMTNLDGQCQEVLKEKNIRKLLGLVKRPKKTISLEESCESLIVGAADG